MHCERAEKAGVRVGMTLAHARSLLSRTDVWIQPYTPDEDLKCLHRLARWAGRFSPVVAVDRPDGLFLDMSGCDRLFGGEERLVETIAASLDKMGFPARIALAHTFGCARAVAQYTTNRTSIIPAENVLETIAPLPIAALRVDANTLASLADVGVEQIGQLLSLSRDALASRFGNELLQRVDQLVGEAAEVIEPIRPEKCFEASVEFDDPVSQWEIVQETVRRLLFSLVADVSRSGNGVCQLDIELRRTDATPIRLSFALAYPSHDPKHLWTLIQPQVERVHVGYGVEEIHLRAARTQRLDHHQSEFWSNDRSVKSIDTGVAWGELLDRLMDRLGRQAVTRMEPVETHVPERAFIPTDLREVKRDKCEAATVISAHRPSRLLETPEPIRIMALVPDGPPAWLSWRGIEGAVLTTNGPERILLPWWTGEESKGRDYYEVQDEHGRWLWLFRVCESGRWFVHGEWA